MKLPAALFVIGHDAFEFPPKSRAVMGVDQVAKLMSHDVVEKRPRDQHKAPVQAYGSVRRTAAPAGLLARDADVLRGPTYERGKMNDASHALMAGRFPVPGLESRACPPLVRRDHRQGQAVTLDGRAPWPIVKLKMKYFVEVDQRQAGRKWRHLWRLIEPVEGPFDPVRLRVEKGVDGALAGRCRDKQTELPGRVDLEAQSAAPAASDQGVREQG